MYNTNRTNLYKGVVFMAVNYNGLWKMLIDKNMSKGDFARLCELPSGTMTKLRNNMPVHLKVIERICIELDCKVEDVIEIVKFDDKTDE